MSWTQCMAITKKDMNKKIDVVEKEMEIDSKV